MSGRTKIFMIFLILSLAILSAVRYYQARHADLNVTLVHPGEPNHVQQ
jgi:hypothetical protein